MSAPNWNGSKWCRYTTRLAVYLRDGMACVWCGRGVEQGAELTLDHFLPRSRGGSNEVTNLITCCFDCNRARCHKRAAVFARELFELRAAEVLRVIAAKRRRALPRVQARQMIAARGTVQRVLEGMRGAA